MRTGTSWGPGGGFIIPDAATPPPDHRLKTILTLCFTNPKSKYLPLQTINGHDMIFPAPIFFLTYLTGPINSPSLDAATPEPTEPENPSTQAVSPPFFWLPRRGWVPRISGYPGDKEACVPHGGAGGDAVEGGGGGRGAGRRPRGVGPNIVLTGSLNHNVPFFKKVPSNCRQATASSSIVSASKKTGG